MQYLQIWTDWLCEGKVGPFNVALVCVALYCFVQIVLMSLSVSCRGNRRRRDDSEQLMYMRYFWVGYGGSKPPLYSWLAPLVAAVFGTSILTLKIRKYVADLHWL